MSETVIPTSTTPVVRGRYAPSPSGDLHLGNLRTALLAWLYARCSNGRFVLRIEDLDQPRMRPDASTRIIEDLRWLELDWDEGPDQNGPYAPYVQSERIAIYQHYLQRLRAADLVYPCYCTRAEIASAPQADAEDGPRYPGTCRTLSNTERQQREASGRRPALRFRVDDQRVVSLQDMIVGPVTQHVQQAVGDFIVYRADGIFAYQFAVVVDDGLMHINQVVRGADLLSSTARQILLFEALGFAVPTFAHAPLVVDSQGKRLSKRDRSEGLAPLQALGMSAAQIVGHFAASMGLVEKDSPISPIELAQIYKQNLYDIMRKNSNN